MTCPQLTLRMILLMKPTLFVLILLVCACLLVAMTPQNGTVTCPVSGNLAISTKSVKVPSYILSAPITNTGTIYVGGVTVTSSPANGPYILAGMSLSGSPQGNTNAYDLGNIYIACTVSTDVIKWLAQ